MLPELEVLEMYGGVSALLVPFHGTLHGVLTLQTQDNIRKAAVVHCAGSDECEWWDEGQPPFDNIKSWTGYVTLSVLSKISTIASNSEVLHVHVRKKGSFHLGQVPVCTLTSAMRSVDIAYKQRVFEDTGSLAFQGLPSDELTHLRVECVHLAIHHEVYSWIMSRPNTNLIGFKACTVLSDRSLFRENQGERDEDFVRFKSTVEGQVGVLQCC